MTRKDFNLIAEVIAELENYESCFNGKVLDAHTVAERFAAALAGTNERFDHARFMAAAEPKRTQHERNDALITKALGIGPGETLKLDVQP